MHYNLARSLRFSLQFPYAKATFKWTRTVYPVYCFLHCYFLWFETPQSSSLSSVPLCSSHQVQHKLFPSLATQSVADFMENVCGVLWRWCVYSVSFNLMLSVTQGKCHSSQEPAPMCFFNHSKYFSNYRFHEFFSFPIQWQFHSPTSIL